jgi:hypothetical protein
MKFQTIAIGLFVLTSSCNSSKFVFDENHFDNITQLTIIEATKYEKRLKSKDVTPNHHTSIGESIYPNERNFDLDTPKSYQRLDGDHFSLGAEYYYNKADSIVKVILYEWNYHYSDSPNYQRLTDKQVDKKYKRFDKKFKYLSKRLTKELGSPTSTEINSKGAEQNFRDGIKWIGESKPKAYLFMFGNDNNQYRQIRLAIYNE